MPQIRLWDYGTPLETIDSVFINANLLPSGVYNGLDLSADPSGLLNIAPGVGLQPDGIVWQETTDLSLAFSPPGAPTNYTVVATHISVQQFGGSAVTYSIQPGIFNYLLNSVILGWIYHPGFGQPLSMAVIQSAPKSLSSSYAALLNAYKSIELFPEYPRCYNDVASSGIDVTFTPKLFETVGQFLIYQQASNNPAALGAEAFIQHLQFFVDETPRPVSVSVYCNVPNSPLTNLTIQVYDSAQVLVPVTDGVITNTVGWETRTATISNSVGTFTPNTPYTLRLLSNLDPGQTIKLARIKVSFWPYP